MKYSLLDLAFVAFLLACVGASSMALDYHSQRLTTETTQARLHMLEVDAHRILEHFTQTLQVSSMSLQSLLESGHALHGHQTWEQLLGDALAHAPYIRSLSLLDDSGQVVVSTHLDNLGFKPALDDFYPATPRWSTMLRIGRLHDGRDLADGQPVSRHGDEPPALAYIPVIRSLAHGEAGQLSLIATINTDYFLQRIHAMAEQQGAQFVELLRLDGAPLLSNREQAHPRPLLKGDLQLFGRWQAGEEIGSEGQRLDDGSHYLSAWRVGRNLPLGVIVRSDRAPVVAAAQEEVEKHARFLLPLIAVVFGMVLLAYFFVRRSIRRIIAAQANQLARISSLLDALPAAVLLFGGSGRLMLANRAWQDFAPRIDGQAAQHPRSVQHYVALFAGSDLPRQQLEDGIIAVLKGQQPAFDVECRLPGDDGLSMQVLVRPFHHEHTHGVAVLQLDTTARRQAEERGALLDAALQASVNAVVITGADAAIQWANPAFTRLTGYELEEVQGRKPNELVSSGRQDSDFYRDLWNTILRGEAWRGELVNRRRNGELYHEAMTITPVRDRNGRLKHFVAVKEDIEERKQHENELKRLANTDPLTGAFNRRAFFARTEAELARLQRYGKPCSLIMLDLDHFKRINDQHGHAAGDATLCHFITLTRNALRQTDSLGRLGGEEFAVLMPETGLDGALELAERIRIQLAATPLDFEDKRITVTVSIGATALQPGDRRPDDILARADAALYRAKQQGRNRSEPATV